MKLNSKSSLGHDRRHFLNTLGLAVPAAVLTSLPALTFAQASATPAQSFRTSTDTETDPVFMSAVKMAQMIREKKISSVELVEAHIKRIQDVNLKINAIVFTCFERAREEARAADQALARGTIVGPLHGVPFAIKDSIDTEGVVTTGGTIGRINFVPEKDATAVARLRDAGAILLGKTNTPEWTLAGGAIPGIGTTANIIYGTTRNPYNIERSTAGSSGGAGAIVAAGGAPFDIGTDWGGSVRGPSNLCGIVGHKPTFGRIPRTGHIVDYGGIHDSWQQFGPMTRKVEDCILIMELISGPDYLDAAIPPMPWSDPAKVDIKSLRVAWYTDAPSGTVSAETQAAVEDTAKAFASAGCKVTQDYPKALIEELTTIRSQISREVAWGLDRLAEKWGSRAVSPTVRARAEREGVTTVKLMELLEKQDHNRSKILQWVQSYDLIINPVFGNTAGMINAGLTDAGGTVNTRGANFNGVHNTTGYPATAVPIRLSDEGLPIGLQLIGQPWRDDVTLAASEFVESTFGGWRKPPI
jgi:amidase